MIRFIDLRDQDIGYGFAFFNTVNNEFISVDDCYVWDNLESFKSYYNTNEKKDFYPLDRFLSVCPLWVF